MREEQRQETRDTGQKISIRWKVLVTLGGALITLGLLIDWPPPQETSLPDTASFLMTVGGLVVTAGLLLALRRE